MSDLLGQLPQPFLLVVAALLVTAETAFVIGLVLPGTSLLLTLGLFAHLGAITPMAATVTAVAAAVGGGQLAYLLGRRRGHLRSISPLTTLVPDSAWSHVVALLTRHGRRTVVVGQWLGGSRPLAARAAGWTGMPYRAFVTVQPLTAAVWAAGLVTLGRFAGQELQQLVGGGLALAGPVLAGAVLFAFWARRRVAARRRRLDAGTAATRGWPA